MKDEYIRKQDAFDAVEARITELMTHPEFRRKHLDIDLSGIIRNISAIKPAEVIPVVRCRDCKHVREWRSEESAKKFGQVYECAMHIISCPNPNDFCSYGKRREENRNDI